MAGNMRPSLSFLIFTISIIITNSRDKSQIHKQQRDIAIDLALKNCLLEGSSSGMNNVEETILAFAGCLRTVYTIVRYMPGPNPVVGNPVTHPTPKPPKPDGTGSKTRHPYLKPESWTHISDRMWDWRPQVQDPRVSII